MKATENSICGKYEKLLCLMIALTAPTNGTFMLDDKSNYFIPL